MKHVSLLLLALMIAAGSAVAGETRATPDTAADRAAHAPTAPEQTADAFSALDADHDGVLSKAEMRQHAKAAHMAMVDENRDGVLSRDEFAELDGM